MHGSVLINNKNKILQCLTKPNGLLRPALVCCPHAGGSANFFRQWVDTVPKEMDMMVVQYAGRGNRLTEPCAYSMDELVVEILPSIQALSSTPYVLFGHSMGAAVAFELCYQLEKLGTPPRALMLSSHPPLDEIVPSEFHLCEELELWQEIVRIGGISSNIIEERELRSLLTLPLRADYQLIETYRPDRNKSLCTPVTVCLGDDDPDVPLEGVDGWQRFCLKPIKKIVRSGGHFYLSEYSEDLIDFAAAVLGIPRRPKKGNAVISSVPSYAVDSSTGVDAEKSVELPVSVGQRMMWLMDHYQGKFGALNCPVILRLEGELDIANLAQVWQKLVDRHETLRTRFVGRGQALKRIVRMQEKWVFQVEAVDQQVCQSDDPVCHPIFQTLLRNELRTPVDIKKRCGRIRLWRLNEKLHVFCVTQHHLITDAWSCGLLSRELGLAFNKKALLDLEWQYSDFVHWEKQQLSGNCYQRHEAYWTDKLKDIVVPDLPNNNRGPSSGNLEEDTISFYRDDISISTVIELEAIARRHGASLFTLMLSLFFIHLHRLTGQKNLSLSTLLANRPHDSSNQTQGFFANMVVLRCIVQSGDGLVDILNNVRDLLSGSIAHQVFPYQLLPPGIVPADAARDVVFQMFAEETHQTEMIGLQITSVDPPDGLARRFDLDLAVIPTVNGIKLIMAASDKRFKARWSNRFLQGFVQLAKDLPLLENNVVIA